LVIHLWKRVPCCFSAQTYISYLIYMFSLLYSSILVSPAAGRTVKRSGLRDTGGIYLVSVYRARSGNIHRAVGQDFVMNVDDVLYFTGMVSEFSQFCESHGLEVITNEIDITNAHRTNNNIDLTPQDDEPETGKRQTVVKFASAVEINEEVNGNGATNDDDEDCEQLPLTHIETRSRRSSINFISEEGEKLQAINRMTGMLFVLQCYRAHSLFLSC